MQAKSVNSFRNELLLGTATFYFIIMESFLFVFFLFVFLFLCVEVFCNTMHYINIASSLDYNYSCVS